jgi:hypothetical protein
MRNVIEYMLVGLASILIFIFLQHNFFETKSSDSQQVPQKCPVCPVCKKIEPTALDDCLVGRFKRIGYIKGLLEGYTGSPVDSIKKVDLAKLTPEQSLRLRIAFDTSPEGCP